MAAKLSQPLLIQDEDDKFPLSPFKGFRASDTSDTTPTPPDGGVMEWIASIGTMHLLVLVLFAVFVEYDPNADKDVDARIYLLERDVSIMIFIGFGYLMTFLKKHGYSAVGFTMLVSCFAIEWTILVFGFFSALHTKDWSTKIPLNWFYLSQGQFGAAAVMISFGALIGKVSADQMMVIAAVEIVFYGLNIYIGEFSIGAIDVGGSIFIHTFGAYFGLACSWVVSPDPKKIEYEDNSNNYLSDLFSFIGCVFLWILWPSFNACVADVSQWDVITLNTVMALVSSAICTFYASRVFRKTAIRGLRFEAVDIQNATLAGGVAVGAASNMQLTPAGAIAVGAVAGFISTAGYVWLQPYLENKIGLQDTCGVHNLHGMPGVLGAVVTIIATAARVEYAAPEENPMYPHNQWQKQLAGIAITLVISLVSGGLTGYGINAWTTKMPALFTDEVDWTVPTAALAFTSTDLNKKLLHVTPMRQRGFIARQRWTLIRHSLSAFNKNTKMADAVKILVAKKRVKRAKRGSIFV